MFERVVRQSLIDYLDTTGKLPENQHGFKAKLSTLTQLLSHWDEVIELQAFLVHCRKILVPVPNKKIIFKVTVNKVK